MDLQTDPQIKALWDAVKQLQQNPVLVDHYHTGFDASRVNWIDINQKRIHVLHTIYGTDAATAANYSAFFITPLACVVNDFREVHTTAGTDGGAVTLQLEKLTGTTAPGGGLAILATALNLKGTANTIQTASIISTANRSLAKNDRLALLKSGTLTSVANVTVMLELLVV